VQDYSHEKVVLGSLVLIGSMRLFGSSADELAYKMIQFIQQRPTESSLLIGG
jgi:hypothetical protein